MAVDTVDPIANSVADENRRLRRELNEARMERESKEGNSRVRPPRDMRRTNGFICSRSISRKSFSWTFRHDRRFLQGSPG